MEDAVSDTKQKSPQAHKAVSRLPASRVSSSAKGVAARDDDRLIRRPNAAHALRVHLAEVLQKPTASAQGSVLAETRGTPAAARKADGPSRKSRDIAEGVRTRAPGYAHLFDPVAPTTPTSDLLNGAGAVGPVLGAADLGVLVRQAREALGQSQAAFAAGAGVGRRFLSELEAGKSTLEIDKVLAVCRAAGVVVLAGHAHGR